MEQLTKKWKIEKRGDTHEVRRGFIFPIEFSKKEHVLGHTNAQMYQCHKTLQLRSEMSLLGTLTLFTLGRATSQSPGWAVLALFAASFCRAPSGFQGSAWWSRSCLEDPRGRACFSRMKQEASYSLLYLVGLGSRLGWWFLHVFAAFNWDDCTWGSQADDGLLRAFTTCWPKPAPVAPVAPVQGREGCPPEGGSVCKGCHYEYFNWMM